MGQLANHLLNSKMKHEPRQQIYTPQIVGITVNLVTIVQSGLPVENSVCQEFLFLYESICLNVRVKYCAFISVYLGHTASGVSVMFA